MDRMQSVALVSTHVDAASGRVIQAASRRFDVRVFSC